jgi:ferric-dicitrate binding protein FerR (iron transport regulator)
MHKEMLHNDKIDSDKSNHEFDQFMAMLSSARVPEKRSKDEAWDLLIKNIEQGSKTEQPSRTIPIRALLSIAATVLILLGGWYSYVITRTETCTAGNGQIATFQLPDKSIVQLNAGSSIHYKIYGFMKHRHITLQGEAFFKIKKGNKFVVQNNNSTVTVLGTSFTIYARNNHFDVKCYTGKVRVESPSIMPVILTRGKSVKTITDSALRDTSLFDPETPISWVNGDFYFSNESLSSVFDEMERQFDITITHPVLSNRTYTGFFNKNNVKTALDNVCLPMGIEYKMIDSKHIEIK